ncbi:hypothetical protein [uncultured Winogradskyella sp.]|uniref:hypothetical protein n=1 Tax=uncultured Winogradskyella sp. TaxID=395353 RepID=UPI003515A9F1
MRKITFMLSLFLGFALSAQVGINTDTPLSTLDINGNLSVKHVSLTGAGTPTLIDDGVYISVNPQANNQDFQLPDPRNFPGRIYIIRNVSDTTNADIVMDPAAVTDGVLFFAGDSSTGSAGPINMNTALGGGHRSKTLIFISDGSNWTYGQLGF